MVSVKKKISEEFIGRVGKIGKRWGLGEPAGKIWGALAFSKKPLTQKEIAKICNYSRGLVSRNLSVLKKMNIAKTASIRGKVKLYSTVSSFSESFNSLVHKFKTEEMSRLFHILEQKVENKKKSARAKMNATLGSLSDS